MTLPWDDPSRPVLGMSLDSGRPCLDLLNTLRPAIPSAQARTATSLDLISAYEDILALAVRTAILPAAEADSLQAWAGREPAAGKDAQGRILEFRALLRRLLVTIARKHPPTARDLAVFEELRSAARSFEVLVWEDDRYRLRPRYMTEGLSAPLHAFVRDADELLRSPDFARIRTVRINSPEARFVLG